MLAAVLIVVLMVVLVLYPSIYNEGYEDYFDEEDYGDEDDFEDEYSGDDEDQDDYFDEEKKTGIQAIVEKTRMMENDAMLDRAKNKYSCELEMRKEVPSCRLNFREGEGSKNRDVKCKIIQEAHTGSSVIGSFTKSGSVILDEGRLRSSPEDDNMTCEMLPTDTLLYPDGINFPICSRMNKNIYDERFQDLVDIYEDLANGRCKIRFKSASQPHILAYSNYLDTKGKEQDISSFKLNLDGVPHGSIESGSG
jgi:hypothetical protein